MFAAMGAGTTALLETRERIVCSERRASRARLGGGGGRKGRGNQSSWQLLVPGVPPELGPRHTKILPKAPPGFSPKHSSTRPNSHLCQGTCPMNPDLLGSFQTIRGAEGMLKKSFCLLMLLNNAGKRVPNLPEKPGMAWLVCRVGVQVSEGVG